MDTFDWAKIVGPALGAILGASLTYFLARGGRRALAYFHLKDVVLIRPDLFGDHALTIHYGEEAVDGYVYLTALRIKNIGINGISKAAIRLAPRIRNAGIVSVGITTRSTLLADRVRSVTQPGSDAQSFEITNMASGDSADFSVLVSSTEKLKNFEQAVSVELEADGKLGRRSKWLRLIYATTSRRREQESEVVVRVRKGDA